MHRKHFNRLSVEFRPLLLFKEFQMILQKYRYHAFSSLQQLITFLVINVFPWYLVPYYIYSLAHSLVSVLTGVIRALPVVN